MTDSVSLENDNNTFVFIICCKRLTAPVDNQGRNMIRVLLMCMHAFPFKYVKCSSLVSKYMGRASKIKLII